MEEPESETGSTCESMKSDRSMGRPIHFSEEHPTEGPGNVGKCDTNFECVSLRSDHSMMEPIVFSDENQADYTEEKLSPEDQKLNDVFKQLEENIITFVKKEMKMFYKAIQGPTPSVREDSEENKSREALLEITLDFLKRMKQEEVAQNLHSSLYCGMSQHELQSMLQEKYLRILEGIPKIGNSIPLNKIYTDLHIIEGGVDGVRDEHEIRWIEGASKKQVTPETTIACEDIFKARAKRDGRISTELTSKVDTQTQVRTVLTLGVAGIGKTVLTQKFCLDWAEGKANQDIHQLFPFTFRELNGLKDKTISLEGLVQHFFIQSIKVCSSRNVQAVFIFDGLDECRFPLDFTQTLTDPTEPSSVGVLVVNLIKGSLLPFARVWFTTRPAAANQIPAECVSMVTEVQGFTDPQKEQYFMKRFSEEEATVVISHIKKSRCLDSMCRIPLFCLITSKVMEHLMKTGNMDQLPTTLTEMYIHFLVVQVKFKGVKYDGKSETDPVWSLENQTMVLSLGKLAFEQLQKGNLIFYELDLVECGLDVKAASMYSGVFTLVFREEPGLYQDKLYSFVHFSVQECLAALHVHVTFVDTGENLLKTQDFMDPIKTFFKRKQDLHLLHQTAVDKALKSPNGQWDLFLRFLLGLSYRSTNEKLFLNLLNKHHSDSLVDLTDKRAVGYIHKKLNKTLSAEKSISLFHCLNELGDNSLVDRVQQQLKEGTLCNSTSPELWSGLVFILLSSDNDLSVFDLKKYFPSEDALQRLLPVVKEATKAILTYCNLLSASCVLLKAVLSSQLSSLRHLDISNNDLGDDGVEQLCLGLKHPECKLETLRLSGCLVSEKGGASLVSALSTTRHLQELDLSYNHPQSATIAILSALQQDHHHSLNTLIVEPAGKKWLIPGLRKYFCYLRMDPNSAHRQLELLNKRTVTLTESDKPYPDHAHRFDSCLQVLCCTELTGRCYWEVDWRGKWISWEADVAVSYKGVEKKGGRFGSSDQSWCLRISAGGYSVLHQGIQTPISSSYSSTDRVAVYLDYPAGSLSFYIIKNGDRKRIHLHTFFTTFTKPLYAGIGFGPWSKGVSVSFDNLL